ncbi:glycosyltransferase family 4 protein [Leptobacterium sp. I13]|uniref:glycosyltransferase family 4 protein n=1 Tax=Leptobacterium meishanense TaxID=3128904 RepID=UPI0030EF862A
MKIDFIISSLGGGGAERVMALLANHFALKGNDVTIVTFNDGEAYELNENVKRAKLHGGKIKNHTIRSFINLIRHYYKKRNRPKVAISFITHASMMAIVTCRFYGIKVIASEHNNHLQAKVPVFLTRFARDYIYPLAHYITVLTSYDIDFYQKKGAKVVVMPNPCTFKPLKDSPKTREKVILAVGNLDRYHHKGFDNLIILIAPILKEHPEWHLNIVGGGKNGLAYLKELADSNRVQNQVHFAGFQKNVSALMQKSEIFILPSRFEGLPMVLLEAMSQGMACIAYDCVTGPSDIINNNINGLLIEDQNQEAMQKGLRDLINDPSLRETLSTRAIRSLERFSMETIGNKWEMLFKNILTK